MLGGYIVVNVVWIYRNPHTCHFLLMFYKHQYKCDGFISVFSTEGCILRRERVSDFSVHFCLVTFWWSGQQAKSVVIPSPPRTKSGLWDWPWPSCAALPASAAGRICLLFLWIPSSHLPTPRQTGGWGGIKRYNTFINWGHCTKIIIH